MKMLNIEEEKIHVIYQGVNHSLYRPMDKESCRKHFGLNPNKKYILYVASNLYHKRVDLAKRVFEEVRKSREDVVFIKAGYSEKLQGENILRIRFLLNPHQPFSSRGKAF